MNAGADAVIVQGFVGSETANPKEAAESIHIHNEVIARCR